MLAISDTKDTRHTKGDHTQTNEFEARPNVYINVTRHIALTLVTKQCMWQPARNS